MSDTTWVKGQPSRYEKREITHWPHWEGVICWDAYFNNLTAGLMVASTVVWLFAGSVFAPVFPYVLTVALALVVIDLLILITDLGDKWRFIHAMRIFRPSSPLSVGVWSLAFYTFFLSIAVALFWFSWLASYEGYDLEGYSWLASSLATASTLLAFLGACAVIVYKGVAFSCTAQPGLKDARWLTSFMVSDALLMGVGLIVIVAFLLEVQQAVVALVVPLGFLIIFRMLTFWLLSLNLSTRTNEVYSLRLNRGIKFLVYGIGGVVALSLLFFGIYGTVTSAGIGLILGVAERQWIIGVAAPKKEF